MNIRMAIDEVSRLSRHPYATAACTSASISETAGFTVVHQAWATSGYTPNKLSTGMRGTSLDIKPKALSSELRSTHMGVQKGECA